MTTTSIDLINVIPVPLEVSTSGSYFELERSTPICVGRSAAAGKGAAEVLQRELNLRPIMASTSLSADVAAIRFQSAAVNLGPEAYILTVSPEGITIEAAAAAGWFYGVQTLLQLLGPPAAKRARWQIPCVRIVDEPRFRWRGLMLDVARHLMPVEGLLRLLDTMAGHKLNTFHWHLTDDQGWRIQSLRYPRLTEIGAWRRGADGVLTPGNAPERPPGDGTYGGFYTHDDVRRVVAHAAALHIRVVPEIEMPGHAVAALAAYPELSCTGGTFEPATRTGVFKDVYCAGNDATFDLLEGVLDEIIPLFPGEFFHVGGDECPKDRWRSCLKCQERIRAEGLHDEHELQSYVIRRMERFLNKRGRRLIGWDEILEGGLAPGAAVMSWRGIEGGMAAAQAGHDVVMTPHTHCYLDYRQAQEGEPQAIGSSVTPLEKSYGYEPIPHELTPQQAKHILGVQGNVWTEYMPDIRHVEYMIWPRAAAIAEIGWSRAECKDFSDFRRRVQINEARLAEQGSAFRPVRGDL